MGDWKDFYFFTLAVFCHFYILVQKWTHLHTQTQSRIKASFIIKTTSETETQRPTQGKQESKTDTPTKDGAGLFIHRKQAGDEKQKRNEM